MPALRCPDTWQGLPTRNSGNLKAFPKCEFLVFLPFAFLHSSELCISKNSGSDGETCFLRTPTSWVVSQVKTDFIHLSSSIPLSFLLLPNHSYCNPYASELWFLRNRTGLSKPILNQPMAGKRLWQSTQMEQIKYRGGFPWRSGFPPTRLPM